MAAKPRDRVCLGTIAAAHGVRGEVKIRTFTATPEAIGDYGPLELEDGSRAFAVERRRPAEGGVIAKLAGIDDRNGAESLRGQMLYVPRSRLPEPEEEDEYYLADLIGLQAVRPTGERLGEVVAVENFGAGDLLEIERPGAAATVYVPFTREAVPEVDIAGGKVVVDLFEGLE
ncbi:ribosome maturation factor RimM [Rhodoligotrophos defluvii]|uniref:ribosome maturation factor RimM n=1 Tax=Rhodoligotrophos defluvii TaxID=2561934 RepID=UPI0010CA13FB|nr:ribosome maturation factor RimM [Rhodoligotrophos defluvii]